MTVFLLSLPSCRSLISKWSFRDGDSLPSLTSVVIAKVKHINHTFVFHLTEMLLRKMEISSWWCVCQLFLFQAVLFSLFYFPSSHSGAPTTSVVWFGLERRERDGGRGVCMCVWYKREFNFLCCLQRTLQLCVKLHHISPDDMKRGLQMLTSVTSPVVSKFTQIWWNFIFILSHWEKGDPDLNVVRCTADGQRRTEETRARVMTCFLAYLTTFWSTTWVVYFSIQFSFIYIELHHNGQLKAVNYVVGWIP